MSEEKKFEVHIRGTAPLLMHNGMLADQEYVYSKALKLVSKRRSKNEDDRGEMAEHEFQGGMYFEDGVGPGLPSGAIEAAIKNSAKQDRAGKIVTSALFVDEEFLPLIYDGPKTREALWADARYRDRRIAVVQRARVARTRPRFPKWEIKFTITMLPCELNAEDLERYMRYAGCYVGLGDYRPKYGRFEVVSFKQIIAGKKAA